MDEIYLRKRVLRGPQGVDGFRSRFFVFYRDVTTGEITPSKIEKNDAIMNTEDFISKARNIHGDVYDYSQVNYVNLKTKIQIICPEHGLFEIIPDAHLRGHKCLMCECLENKASRRIHSLINKIDFPLPTSFVAIDFETLYSQPLSACSVGMVKFRNGQIVDTFYSLIKPPAIFDGKKHDFAQKKHHITEDQLVDQQTMEAILPEMEHFVEGLPLVAHHADTERCCIKDTSNFYGIQTNLNYDHIYDTQQISELVEIANGFLISGGGSHTLDTVCLRFDVEEKEHHHALDDARVCGMLFNIFIKKLVNGIFIKHPLQEVVFEPKKTSKKTNLFAKEKYRPEDKIPRTDFDNIPNNYFKGKVVCLTGFTEIKSQEYGHELWKCGAILEETIKKNVRILICGNKPGQRKLEQAAERNIEILKEEDLLHLIDHEYINLFE